MKYAMIHDFYAARGGALSGESDFGAWWTDGPPRGPRYRVSAVHDTGDIYAVNQWTGEVELLGHVEPGECPGGVRHDLYAGCAYTLAEARLKGWADEARDLAWVRERLRKEDT